MKKLVGAPSLVMAAIWLLMGLAGSARSAPQETVQALYFVLSVLCLILAAISALIDEVKAVGKGIERAATPRPLVHPPTVNAATPKISASALRPDPERVTID